MPKLCNSSWWPNAWIDEQGNSADLTELRKSAVLKNVRRSSNELVLILEQNGHVCTAKTGGHLSDEFVVLIRHLLLQHWGELVSSVEEIEVDLSALGLLD